MKNATLKTLLFSTALCASTPALLAQTPSFEQDYSFREKYGWANSMCAPIVADFDLDGINDIVLDGQGQSLSWQTRTVFAKGTGVRADYIADFEPVWKHPDGDSTFVEKYDTIWMYDDNDQIVVDKDGNKVWEELKPVIDEETGKPVVDTIVNPCSHYVTTKNGLPQTSYSYGSQPIDYNNDGLVDLLIINSGGRGDARGLYLVRNDGNGHFTVVKDEALALVNCDENPSRDNNGEAWWNEGAPFGSIVTGDYDKDGYTDILIQSMGYRGRGVTLFRNIGGEYFKEAKVFIPLPFDEEINARGLYEEVESVTTEDPETGDPTTTPGYYLTDKPTMCAKPMSHGQVAFFDFNNDGWLDIVACGWADGRAADEFSNRPEEEPGGGHIRFYQNRKDGCFDDVTPQLIPLAGKVLTDIQANNPDAENNPVTINGDMRDVFRVWGGTDLTMIATDYDQNGVMDLMISGYGRNNIKVAIALMVEGSGESSSIREELLPFGGAGRASMNGFLYVDFNGDDVPDLYNRGHIQRTSGIGDGTGQDWLRVAHISQDGELAFSNHDLGYWNKDFFGGFMWPWDDNKSNVNTFGDFDNDGKIDVGMGNYEGGTDNFFFSYNTTDYEPTAPEAPSSLTLTAEPNGEVLAQWEGGYLTNTRTAMFNVYIENQGTGERFMLVPANKETGKQLCHSMFGTYATNFDENEGMSYYRFTHLPAGTYTVGVQSVGYSYLGSEFVTEEVEVKDGWNNIESVKEASSVKVSVEDNMVTVHAAASVPVVIYNISGSEVATGMTNAPIAVNSKGVFLVKVSNETVKIVK